MAFAALAAVAFGLEAFFTGVTADTVAVALAGAVAEGTIPLEFGASIAQGLETAFVGNIGNSVTLGILNEVGFFEELPTIAGNTLNTIGKGALATQFLSSTGDFFSSNGHQNDTTQSSSVEEEDEDAQKKS